MRVVEIRSVERNSVLACEICDSTGDLTALFYGRSRIAGLMCGSRVRFRGQVGIKGGAPVMVNPAYELIVPHVAAGQARTIEPNGPGCPPRRPPSYPAGATPPGRSARRPG